jgi:ABC-type Na+ efflux pump permease subunit
MPRQNIIFAIVAPLILMAIIAVIVISIGETLLAVHEWAHHLYHVGAYPTAEENHHWAEMAALYPVVVALAVATLFLIGGAVASRLAPQPKHH